MNHSTKIPVTVSAGDDELEIIVDVEFTIRAGSPAILYGDNSHPGDPAEIEFVSVYLILPIEGQPRHFTNDPAPQWLADFITSSDAVYQACGEASEWGENDGPDPDDEYERRRDDARDFGE